MNFVFSGLFEAALTAIKPLHAYDLESLVTGIGQFCIYVTQFDCLWQTLFLKKKIRTPLSGSCNMFAPTCGIFTQRLVST